MPSFPIRCAADMTSFAVTDFNVGIAEQWLESAQGGGPRGPVPEVQQELAEVLALCKSIRTALRKATPRINAADAA